MQYPVLPAAIWFMSYYLQWIPNLSYYLQYNTQSYLLQYIYVVLPAMKSLICGITCNEIPNLSYYLQWNP